MVAASAAPSRRLGAVGGSAGAGRLTEWGYGWPSAVLGLQDWGCGAPYGGRYEEAQERVREGRSEGRGRGSLAGYMGVCSMARRGVRGILRAVLRAIFQPVLRAI